MIFSPDARQSTPLSGRKSTYHPVRISQAGSFNAVPQHIRDDIVEASAWARKTLTEHEGAGHDIYVTAAENDCVVCSFGKPEWFGDHCGSPMEHGAEAIVMAVCEYLHGM